MNLNRSRYSVLVNFIWFFLLVSFIVRTVLLAFAFHKADLTLLSIARIYTQGLIFDTIVALSFCAAYSLYLLVLPERLNRSIFNKVITYTGFFLVVLITMFSFFAEVAFWTEFESRFNFIAVDYLVYTFEVINNINQSYPLPWLISGMVLASLLVTFAFHKRQIFQLSFTSPTRFGKRLLVSVILCSVVAVSYVSVSNDWAEHGPNRYQNELSKAGIFSFFAAYKNNELNYFDFYSREDQAIAFKLEKQQLVDPYTKFNSTGNNIRRLIDNPGAASKPNVILVTIESFSADFMQHFGNTQHLTPVLDSLANKSILFTDMYATGTRTVRGMEALTLCVPPTPGNSIVRRKDNANLFNVGTVFKNAGYKRSFFYGGDGYFDNMNEFFGENGFDIVDKGGRLLPGETFATSRTIIPNQNIHFQNAWGICDEDLYDAVIRDADKKHEDGQPFFDFVMTTSNHRPYTYPEGKIDIPSGSGRDGAVKYTDYAIGKFLEKLRSKPWFKNTVIIFVADHCASSAGKDEIDISKYHIPCMIYNLTNETGSVIGQQCSQIDLFPTLFGLLNWRYVSGWYGENVLLPDYQPRAWVATYQQLGYLQHDNLVVLSPEEKIAQYKWNKLTDEQHATTPDPTLTKQAIATYQTAYYLYKNGGMKE